MLRVDPDLLDVSCGGRGLLPRDYIEGDGGGDDDSCDDGGHDHMAGAFGEFFATGSVVELGGVLL